MATIYPATIHCPTQYTTDMSYVPKGSPIRHTEEARRTCLIKRSAEPDAVCWAFISTKPPAPPKKPIMTEDEQEAWPCRSKGYYDK